MSYAEVYEDKAGKELANHFSEARKAAMAEWESRLLAEKKRLHPRRRKNLDTILLPDEFMDPLRKEILAKYKCEELTQRIKEARDFRKAKLYELAPTVEFTPSADLMCMVKTSSTSTYSSQGFGAERYARAALEGLEGRLKSLGLDTHIRYVVRWTNPHGKWSCERQGGDYQLWVNCPHWMADAAERSMSFEEEIKLLKSQNVNVLALYPFLNCSPALIAKYNLPF